MSTDTATDTHDIEGGETFDHAADHVIVHPHFTNSEEQKRMSSTASQQEQIENLLQHVNELDVPKMGAKVAPAGSCMSCCYNFIFVGYNGLFWMILSILVTPFSIVGAILISPCGIFELCSKKYKKPKDDTVGKEAVRMEYTENLLRCVLLGAIYCDNGMKCVSCCPRGMEKKDTWFPAVELTIKEREYATQWQDITVYAEGKQRIHKGF